MSSHILYCVRKCWLLTDVHIHTHLIHAKLNFWQFALKSNPNTFYHHLSEHFAQSKSSRICLNRKKLLITSYCLTWKLHSLRQRSYPIRQTLYSVDDDDEKLARKTNRFQIFKLVKQSIDVCVSYSQLDTQRLTMARSIWHECTTTQYTALDAPPHTHDCSNSKLLQIDYQLFFSLFSINLDRFLYSITHVNTIVFTHIRTYGHRLWWIHVCIFNSIWLQFESSEKKRNRLNKYTNEIDGIRLRSGVDFVVLYRTKNKTDWAVRIYGNLGYTNVSTHDCRIRKIRHSARKAKTKTTHKDKQATVN